MKVKNYLGYVLLNNTDVMVMKRISIELSKKLKKALSGSDYYVLKDEPFKNGNIAKSGLFSDSEVAILDSTNPRKNKITYKVKEDYIDDLKKKFERINKKYKKYGIKLEIKKQI